MIVLDSSSLILLAKIGVLDIAIQQVKHKLVIPEQVYLECISKKEAFDAKIIEERVNKKLIIWKKISNTILYNKILSDFNLGKGEAEAIALCIERNSGLISDDKKAINACKILKIDFMTVLRLIIEFYKRDLITKDETNAIAKKLQKFGRYSEDILNKMKEDLK